MSNDLSVVQKILDRALEKTESKALAWVKASETEFRAVFPRSAIEIWYNEKSAAHVFSLINEDGQYVAHLNAAKVESPEKEKISQLYKLVKSQVNKVDITVSDILDHLN